jgi:hypothetical protein
MDELMRRLMEIKVVLKSRAVKPLPSTQRLVSAANTAFIKVYEAAPALFLECTILEPRPEIVEIQQLVMQTTITLMDLLEASLLKRLAWPVYVAASMALGAEEQEFFKNLHEHPGAAWGQEGNVNQELRVAFEC